MNVLTKTCRGFVKRVAAYIVAGTVAATLIPAAVSAEDTAAAPTLWETVSEISMDGFKKTKSGSWMVAGEKTVGERTVTVQTNAGGDPWIVCPESGFCDVASDADLAVNAPDITENGKLFVLNRGNGLNGYWRPTSIKSGIHALNLFDKTKIAAGDKIKITAYVYAKNICRGEGNYNNSDVDQMQNVSARIWLTEPWKSNEQPGYNTNCDPNKETFIGEIPAGKWSELSLEYTAGTGNMDINGIEINNYPGSKDGIYPLNLYLAGVKVERQTSVKSAYTKTLENINMDGFTVDQKGAAAVWNGFKSHKTVGDRTYSVNGSGGNDTWTQGCWSNFVSVPDNMDTVPDITKNNKLFYFDRRYPSVGGAGSNHPSSKAAIIAGNMFDTSKVSVGDKIRVDAWLYAKNLATMGGVAADNQNQSVNYRIWLMEEGSDTVTAVNSHEPGSDAASGTMMPLEWTKISLEYVVNDTNKALNSVRIDNYTDGGVYPQEIYLAGVTVEKFENGGWYTVSENGNASGEIYANNAGVTEGSKLMVAAYEGNTFLGCDILDINGEASPFSVTGAANADKVCAYVWDMTTLKPQAGVIGLTKAE